MRHARFRDPAGAVRTGVYHGETVVAADQEYDLADPGVRLLPPCEPEKIVCVGRNYAAHAAERDADVPDRPLLFLKPPNTVAPPGATTPLPAGKTVEHEAELAAVIGTQARNVTSEAATDYLAGFTCLNDVSNRDDQNREQNWVRGKAFDGAAPLGPCVAEPDHVPRDASVELEVNGNRVQSGSRERLVFDVPELIAEVTSYLTLEPGDVIATGTPAGVGPLSDGDHVGVHVEGVGTLEHDVAREDT
ncbi:MAG: 2-keto-4-pentenoate hydratase/2-oxohepta-3-ene-1,7-dioic acid hydratase (catechol pathway) [halophilic archaeon J07HB67]|nr:MAG: 2-keto-4-pentenoate hydratase/2-oxohepta-3-ene-1,7-dioic acid hydratase (catechol pathway) [halophilic archaeon J07HB67]